MKGSGNASRNSWNRDRRKALKKARRTRRDYGRARPAAFGSSRAALPDRSRGRNPHLLTARLALRAMRRLAFGTARRAVGNCGTLTESGTRPPPAHRMANQATVNSIERAAIWVTGGRKCFFCGQLLSFRNLEVDHLIPRSSKANTVDELRSELGLPSDFNLESFLNRVPTHADCNRRKRHDLMSRHNLRYYFEIWGKAQPKLRQELERFKTQSDVDELVTQLLGQIHAGAISVREIVDLISVKSPDLAIQPSDPMVICLSCMVEDFENLPFPPPQLYDRMEQDLLTNLRGHLRRPLAMTEPSARDGESLSVRVAVWYSDLERIESAGIEPWSITELVPYTELYNEVGPSLYTEALQDSLDSILTAEREGCPECGAPVAVSSGASESGEYVVATCTSCGWNDFHG